MMTKARTWGQFATPTDLADLLLGFCVPNATDRLLDPSCGDGALLSRAAVWQAWLRESDGSAEPEANLLFGVELDPAAAATAAKAIPSSTIIRSNFFTLQADDLPRFDSVIGNPPYTRAEWIGHLDAAAGAQLALFPMEPEPTAVEATRHHQPLVPREMDGILSGRAGLYAYFFLHSGAFLYDGGRLGYVVPNVWLDVAYGRELKQFLLDHFCIIAVVESAVERWFEEAGVNACLIVLERCDKPGGREANLTHFIRLRRPLAQLLGPADAGPDRAAAVTGLIQKFMPNADNRDEDAAVRVRRQSALDPDARWGLTLRAPEVYLSRPRRRLRALRDWAGVQRGHTTGANQFFYLDAETIAEWNIEPEFRRPLLKSLRHVDRLKVATEDCEQELLLLPPDRSLRGTAVADYIAWGEEQGIHRRRTCAARHPWYSLAPQTAADLVLPKGIWQRHRAPLVAEPLAADQQLYQIMLAEGVSPLVAGALLNSAWFALQCELEARINLGEGVLWLAGYELEGLQLPDPRTLPGADEARLEQSFRRLLDSPVTETASMLDQFDRWTLDEVVFDLIGLPPGERLEVRAALVEALEGRRLRARGSG